MTVPATNEPGRIVVLNGAPRSGKSSIVAALQSVADGTWMNLGVDAFDAVTPPHLRPGIGLRPGGGERPDIEALLPRLYTAFYDSVAAHSRQGLDVVVDIGHHDHYTRPLGLLVRAARRLAGLPAWLVGVRCPLDVIVTRRVASQPSGRYQAAVDTSGRVTDAVRRWQHAVHDPGVYDLEVDTSTLDPTACATVILDRLASGPPPRAFATLAAAPGEAGQGIE